MFLEFLFVDVFAVSGLGCASVFVATFCLLITIFGIKIKISNRKPVKEIFEYLLKYKNILEKEPHDFEISNDNQNYIWQYWHQGKDNAPKFVKICLKSVEKYSENQTIKIEKL